MKIKIGCKKQVFLLNVAIIFNLTILLPIKAISSQTPKFKNQYNITNNKQAALLIKNHTANYLDNKLVMHYVKIYSKCAQLPKLINRSKSYIEQIVVELDQMNLPRELALLPIIESAYRLTALSNKGAAGIWQISYHTGKRYGLINTLNNQIIKDHRYDVIASTKAALSYLNFLYKKFNNDWLLALAAYNAGEGRISRAIHKNKFINSDPNYWELALPIETQHYVPKFLALAIIFSDPASYGVKLNLI